MNRYFRLLTLGWLLWVLIFLSPACRLESGDAKTPQFTVAALLANPDAHADQEVTVSGIVTAPQPSTDIPEYPTGYEMADAGPEAAGKPILQVLLPKSRTGLPAAMAKISVVGKFVKLGPDVRLIERSRCSGLACYKDRTMLLLAVLSGAFLFLLVILVLLLVRKKRFAKKFDEHLRKAFEVRNTSQLARFVQDNPRKTHYVAEARKAVEEIDTFNAATKMAIEERNVSYLNSFLIRFPSSRLKDKIESLKMEMEAFRQATSSRDLAVVEDFIKKYPWSQFVKQAESFRVELHAFTVTIKSRNPKHARNFLLRFPASPFRNELKEIIDAQAAPPPSAVPATPPAAAPAPPPPKPQSSETRILFGKLHLVEGQLDSNQKMFPITKADKAEGCSLGREMGNDIVLAHDYISRKQAILMRSGNGIAIRNIADKNILFIEKAGAGKKIPVNPGYIATEAVEENDFIIIGDLKFRLEVIAKDQMFEVPPDQQHPA